MRIVYPSPSSRSRENRETAHRSISRRGRRSGRKRRNVITESAPEPFSPEAIRFSTILARARPSALIANTYYADVCQMLDLTDTASPPVVVATFSEELYLPQPDPLVAGANQPKFAAGMTGVALLMRAIGPTTMPGRGAAARAVHTL